MKKLLLLSTLLLVSSFNFCPTPLTHHHFALLYLRHKALSVEEERAFLVGTQLPDIRFLAHLSREATHPKLDNLEAVIRCQSPFVAGKLLHSYVDDFRLPVVEEEFGGEKWRRAVTYGVSADSYIDHPLKSVPWNFDAFLKFVEGEFLSRQYVASSLEALYKDIYNEVDQDTYKKEFGFDITQDVVEQWHEKILNFLTHPPSDLVTNKPETFVGLNPNLLKNWGPRIEPFSKDQTTKDYVDRLTKFFDSEFSKGLFKKQL